MKTLKKFFTSLEAILKKNFFNNRSVSFNSTYSNFKDEKNKLTPDVEGMRLEEYVSRYKSTTRWQTI